MSSFVELIACETADARVVCEALVDWFKRYGVVRQWVSDQGSHFKNQVMDMLRKVVGSQHHFTTAYCPFANGTVEVVNRMILKCIKSSMSELKLSVTQWYIILPLVQAAINGMPSDKLGGIAPVTAFAALPASNPLHSIFVPSTKTSVSVNWVRSAQGEHVKNVQRSLENMHKYVSEQANQKREKARNRHATKRGVAMPRFEIGDFVLVGRVIKSNKLALHWKGPWRIVRALNDFTFEVQNLCEPYEVIVRHASRLKFYDEASRNVAEDLIEHIKYSEGGHLVQKFMNVRKNAYGEWEIQVKWIGMEDEEPTWEPARIMLEDVPILLKQFVDQHGTAPITAMWRSITKKTSREKSGGRK